MHPELPGVGSRAATTLVAFRWSTYDVPFWARANTRPGRWHVAGDEPTQYWSLDPHAAWAELIRQESLTHEDELEHVRMPLWVCRVRPSPIVDLRDAETRAEHGIAADALVAEDWSACQELGGRLRRQGVAGVVAPCAALPSASNLTVFGPRRAIDWSTSPVLASTVPAVISAVGRPPRGLVRRVQQVSTARSDTLF